MVRPRKAHRQRDALKLRHVLATMAAAIVIAAGLVGWQCWRTARLGPRLTTLVVSGDFKRADPAALRVAVRPYLGGGFFRVNLDAVRAAVVALPWIEDAEASLQWPATLKIELREQRAVARWNGGALMNADGVVFARAVPADLDGLPALAGPAGSAPQVLAAFKQMRGMLDRDRLVLTGLSLDARGAWRAQLAQGPELRLGQAQAMDRLQRFVTIVPRVLGARLAQTAYVDMRYSNGFAVGWKKESDQMKAGSSNA